MSLLTSDNNIWPNSAGVADARSPTGLVVVDENGNVFAVTQILTDTLSATIQIDTMQGPVTVQRMDWEMNSDAYRQWFASGGTNGDTSADAWHDVLVYQNSSPGQIEAIRIRGLNSTRNGPFAALVLTVLASIAGAGVATAIAGETTAATVGAGEAGDIGNVAAVSANNEIAADTVLANASAVESAPIIEALPSLPSGLAPVAGEVESASIAEAAGLAPVAGVTETSAISELASTAITGAKGIGAVAAGVTVIERTINPPKPPVPVPPHPADAVVIPNAVSNAAPQVGGIDLVLLALFAKVIL